MNSLLSFALGTALVALVFFLIWRYVPEPVVRIVFAVILGLIEIILLCRVLGISTGPILN